MVFRSLADIEHAIRSSWSEQTCDWNRLASGVEVDLTRDQFSATEIVQEPDVVPRPPDTTSGRLATQYAVLATAVRARTQSSPART